MFAGKFRVTTRGRLLILTVISDKDRSRIYIRDSKSDRALCCTPDRGQFSQIAKKPRIFPRRFSRSVKSRRMTLAVRRSENSRFRLYLKLDALEYRDNGCQSVQKGGETHRKASFDGRVDVSHEIVSRCGRICSRRLSSARLRHSAAKLPCLYKRISSGALVQNTRTCLREFSPRRTRGLFESFLGEVFL